MLIYPCLDELVLCLVLWSTIYWALTCWGFNVFNQIKYCARNFLSSTKFQEKSCLDFSSFQDHSRISAVVLRYPSRPEFCPNFFGIFLSNWTRKQLSYPGTNNLGSGLQSCLVSSLKKARERRPLMNGVCIGSFSVAKS